MEDVREIGSIFTSYYQKLFGTAQDHHLQINLNTFLGPKALHNLHDLDAPFTHEEIKVAVFVLSADKAPSLDGIPIRSLFREVLGNCQD